MLSPSAVLLTRCRSALAGTADVALGCARGRLSLLILGLLSVGSLSGCAVLHEAGVPGLERYVKDENAPLARTQQERYQVHRDGHALRWLLAHRISNGQSLSEVSAIIGEEGERLYDDRSLKTQGGHYLATDVGYKWGPDDRGQSVVLFFREGKLVNFDPDEVAAPRS